MPAKQTEPVTLEQLGELVRRVEECAESLATCRDRLAASDLESIELAIKTGKTRIEQIEAFTRSVTRAVKIRVDTVRDDAARYKSRRKRKS